jgi:hypothetical protein
MARRARSFVAAFGSLVYVVAGGPLLYSSLSNTVAAARMFRAGSGGLGAVSIALNELLLEVALPALAIAVNRLLAPWARRSDGAMKALHRAQQGALVVALVGLFAVPVAFLASVGPLPFVLLPLSGVLWSIAFLLTAALLLAYASVTMRVRTNL